MKRFHSRTSLTQAALALALSGLSASCNLYSFLDQPASSDQYLSRARACMDLGDYECARENYAKVSGDSLDNAKSEQAFAILAQEGIELGDFYSALTATSDAGGSGASINALADKLAKASPGKAKRLALFAADQLAESISSSSTDLRGLTRLVTSMSLAAEVLAESAGTDGVVDQSDLVSGNAATCAASGACAVDSSCAPSSIFENSTQFETFDLDSLEETDINGDAAPMDLLRAAINKINTALSDLGQGGSTESAGDFADAFSSIPGVGVTQFDQCYMNALLNQGIGQ